VHGDEFTGLGFRFVNQAGGMMILGKLQWREREEEASGEGLPRVKGESVTTHYSLLVSQPSERIFF
jgi:hypothetical protein